MNTSFVRGGLLFNRDIIRLCRESLVECGAFMQHWPVESIEMFFLLLHSLFCLSTPLIEPEQKTGMNLILHSPMSK
jgi:hypothetical protein